jgi:succinyl-diaminopimelate desuccinylase
MRGSRRDFNGTVIDLCSAWDHIDQSVIIDLARRLIAFDTTNPPGNEEPAIRWLGSYLQTAGIPVTIQPLAAGRANLIARLPGAGQTGHLVLSGHMDVVPPGLGPWTYPPFAGEQVGDRLYGRGAADMKGGVAALAAAMIALTRADFRPRGDLILVVTAGEEEGGLGARGLVESGALAGSAGLVVGEFTGLDVCIAHKGGCRLRITLHGKAAHSAMPHLGVNAVAAMAHLVTALQANPFSFTPHPLLGQSTVSVTTISGGEKINVIPERCTIGVNIRTVPGQTLEGVLDETRRLLDTVTVDFGVRAEVESLGLLPVVTPRDHPLVDAAVASVTSMRGVIPNIGGLPYGTDALTLAPAYGLPFVIVGPGHFDQAHQIDEWVDVSELTQAARIYALLAQRILGDAPAE